MPTVRIPITPSIVAASVARTAAEKGWTRERTRRHAYEQAALCGPKDPAKAEAYCVRVLDLLDELEADAMARRLMAEARGEVTRRPIQKKWKQ